MRALLASLVRFYKRFISPLTPPSCRYYPSCSSYALLLLRFDNLALAVLKIAYRILRCQPFCKGGFDYPCIHLSIQKARRLKAASKASPLARPKTLAKSPLYLLVEASSGRGLLPGLRKFYIITVYLK